MSEIAGFPELSVAEEIVMQRVMAAIKTVYQTYGYVPLETRLVEYADVLEQKGIDGKEVRYYVLLLAFDLLPCSTLTRTSGLLLGPLAQRRGGLGKRNKACPGASF